MNHFQDVHGFAINYRLSRTRCSQIRQYTITMQHYKRNLNMKSSKRNVKVPKVMWIAECKNSSSNVNLTSIHVVVNTNNSHWIEWFFESQNIYAGISL